MAMTRPRTEASPRDRDAAPSSPVPDSTGGPGRGSASRVIVGLALAVASGALATLAFPPFGLWPLIFVAFVPMVVAQHRIAPRRWSGAVFGLGVGTFLSGQLSVGLHQGDVAPVFESMPLIFAGIFALVAWRSRAFHERTDYRWLAISTPLAWVAIDFVRNLGALSALGGTWANPVYALYRHPIILQPISVFSMYGLELLVLVINFAIATAVIRALDHRPAPVTLLNAVAIAVVAWVALGGLLIDHSGSTVRVAAIQTGTANGAFVNGVNVRFARDIAQTHTAAAQGARLAVWSEGGLPFDPRVEHTAELHALAAETNMAIAVGYGLDDSQGRHHNEVVLFTPDGKISDPYGKDHPGTFAGDYSDTQGTYPVVQTDFGPVGTVICYDMDFTDTARKMTRNGARIIAASSSDVPAIADTHYTHLVFRSIENHVSTVKGDKGFDSAIIDPWGRIVKSTANPSGQAQRTVVGDVPLGSGHSLFVTLGDSLGWISVIATALMVITSKVTKRRVRQRG